MTYALPHPTFTNPDFFLPLCATILSTARDEPVGWQQIEKSSFMATWQDNALDKHLNHVEEGDSKAKIIAQAFPILVEMTFLDVIKKARKTIKTVQATEAGLRWLSSHEVGDSKADDLFVHGLQQLGLTSVDRSSTLKFQEALGISDMKAEYTLQFLETYLDLSLEQTASQTTTKDTNQESLDEITILTDEDTLSQAETRSMEETHPGIRLLNDPIETSVDAQSDSPPQNDADEEKEDTDDDLTFYEADTVASSVHNDSLEETHSTNTILPDVEDLDEQGRQAIASVDLSEQETDSETGIGYQAGGSLLSGAMGLSSTANMPDEDIEKITGSEVDPVSTVSSDTMQSSGAIADDEVGYQAGGSLLSGAMGLSSTNSSSTDEDTSSTVSANNTREDVLTSSTAAEDEKPQVFDNDEDPMASLRRVTASQNDANEEDESAKPTFIRTGDDVLPPSSLLGESIEGRLAKGGKKEKDLPIFSPLNRLERAQSQQQSTDTPQDDDEPSTPNPFDRLARAQSQQSQSDDDKPVSGGDLDEFKRSRSGKETTIQGDPLSQLRRVGKPQSYDDDISTDNTRSSSPTADTIKLLASWIEDTVTVEVIMRNQKQLEIHLDGAQHFTSDLSQVEDWQTKHGGTLIEALLSFYDYTQDRKK